MVVVVRELVQTAHAFPSQWQGTTDDGRTVYIRYRSGWLEVGLGDSLDEAADASAPLDDAVPLYREKIGGDLDGTEVLDRLSSVLSFQP